MRFCQNQLAMYVWIRVVISKEGIEVGITSLKSQDEFGSDIYGVLPVVRQGARHWG